MEIQHLVDQLEKALNESKRVPMSAYLLVNEDSVYNLIDQLRVAIPEEIKRAGRVEAERDRILAQAKEEGDRIRELARQEAGDLVERDRVVISAQDRADNILEHARQDSAVLVQDADAYVVGVLSKLEDDLLNSLAVVRNGLNKVQIQDDGDFVEAAVNSA